MNFINSNHKHYNDGHDWLCSKLLAISLTSTSLHLACNRNQLEIVKFLTSKAECNRKFANKFGNLPLHLAYGFSGNVELVRYLVKEADCDINAKGKNDYTLLHLACHKNQLEIVKFLTCKAECNHEIMKISYVPHVY